MLLIVSELANDPTMQISFGLCTFFCLYCLIGSWITGNCSQVDRLWSLLPSVYGWLFVYFEYKYYSPSVGSTRVVVMAVLVTLWSLRLTFNYWRKDGYKVGVEDYRWGVLRQFFNYPKRIIPFQLFNILFIAFYQNWLIFGFTLPIYYVQKYARTKPFDGFDSIAAGLFLLFLLFETVSDEQQWRYQSVKWNYINTKRYDPNCGYTESELKQGFLSKGLFAHSRHPNFFAEQSVWWCLYLFTLTANYRQIMNGNYKLLYNQSIYGAFLLTLLFQGSTAFTEYITIKKYPKYKQYQNAVSRLIPLWSGKFKSE